MGWKLGEREQKKEARNSGLSTAPSEKSLEELRSVSALCLPVGGWGFFFHSSTSPSSLPPSLPPSDKPVALSMRCEH